MYKLFLSLRYLRRRHIAYIAVIGVALCVWMVLIVVSVMNGFLGAIGTAARGMLGDIIIDSSAAAGTGHYDQFIADLEKMPEVKAATPVIYSMGILRVGPEYTQAVRLVGVRLPEATQVTRFAQGLYPDGLKSAPSFQIDPKLASDLSAGNEYRLETVNRLQAELDSLSAQLDAERQKDRAQQSPERLRGLEAQINQRIKTIADERQRIYRAEQPTVILGVEIPGLTDRDPVTGATRRALPPGASVRITMMPMGRGRMSALEPPFDRPFTMIGDSRMGVYQIDSINVYMDFGVLQRLLDMDARQDIDTGEVDPGRCSQIQIRVRDNLDDRQLNVLAGRIRALADQYAQEYPDVAQAGLDVQTWSEKQKHILEPIESQRTLMIIMFGVISLVAVVLVFAIFYMMVIQKTRDIGVVKSIGGSNAGVAGIFLTYGGAIGLVGSVLGVIGGSLFVHYINPIHDWIGRTFGFVVFDKQVFLFDKIPNTVDPRVIIAVVVAAIVAGLIGAIVPALRAARMQPVEALRYE